MSSHLQPEIISLPSRSSEADSALRTGWFKNSRVIARQLIAVSEGDPNATVLFERIETSIKRPSGFAPWLQMIRAFSLTATATPCIAVLLFLIHQETELSVGHGIAALIGVLCLQIAINVFNDVSDYRRLIDLPGTLGGSGVIQSGWWSPKALNRFAWLALGAGAVSGLPSVLHHPEILVPIGALGTLGTLFYSARRFGLKYIALGDIAVFALCGPALTYGFAVAAAGTSSAGVVWLGVFFGLLAVGILHVNNIQDLKLDRERGIQTLAIRLGFRMSLRLLAALYFAATAALLGAVSTKGLPAGVLVAVIPLLWVALPWLRKVLPAIGPESALLAQGRIRAAQIHLLSGVALILGLALSVGLGKFGP